MARPKKEANEFESLTLKSTKWKNELKYAQSITLYVPDGAGKGYKSIVVTFKPGEEKVLPSEFDGVIHQVKNGIIVGGLAPQLTKVGSEEVLHESLNVEFQSKKFQREELMKKKLEAMALEQELKEKQAEIK